MPVRVVPQVELAQVPVLQEPPLPRVPARVVLQERVVPQVELPRVLALQVPQALLRLVPARLPLPLQSR